MTNREVYNPRGSLVRQQLYAMRHAIRRANWLQRIKCVDLAGRNSDYYAREAYSLACAIGRG